MLKKKTLTETVYNNGDPFQIREAIGATIGAWQKQEKYQVLWETLEIHTEVEDPITYTSVPEVIYVITVEAVYDGSMA